MAGARRLNRFLGRLEQAGFLLPGALTGYLWLKGANPSLVGWSCPFRALTGIPCPGCFLTRATSASLRGDWGLALSQHVLGPVVAAALVVWSVEAIRRRRLDPPGFTLRNLALFSAALLAYWVVRLVLQYGLGIPVFPTG